MSLTFGEIQHEWFGGEYLPMSPSEVEQAFSVAEQIRGRDWVLGSQDFSAINLPGVGRRGGFSDFLRVYWFGKRVQSILGAPGADTLIQRVVNGDSAAESELTAMYLLRSFEPSTELYIAPPVTVGTRNRQPDFRIRTPENPWVFVEVTQLRRSEVSARIQRLLQRIADQVMQISKDFILEIVFWREPTETEAEDVAQSAKSASEAVDGERRDIGSVASVLVKAGNPAVVVPSILPSDDGTRMAISRAVVGPDQPNRQIIVRAPFADERAEDTLRGEAKQLPKGECGLVIVDATAQPTAFNSWPQLIPPRFRPRQHTRVAGVILFMYAMRPTEQGIGWFPHVNVIENSHASVPAPNWITSGIAQLRAELRTSTGRPD